MVVDCSTGGGPALLKARLTHESSCRVHGEKHAACDPQSRAWTVWGEEVKQIVEPYDEDRGKQTVLPTVCFRPPP